MEFLLINHPLDCPICDQGGECQLQDLAVGYGASGSRYEEPKRVVNNKNLGPLISTDMTRCIHCTRCVRFGQEIAGVMELGMIGRGEHAEIIAFVGKTVDSELSGNVIDLCPVGALTSKPFRYSARTWELTLRPSVSPHCGLGSNLTVQVKQNRVMRVLPRDNEEINECWLSDKDRFSYEGLNSASRLAKPMIKQNGAWKEVDWQVALDFVAQGLKKVREQHGADAHRRAGYAAPDLEELYLLQKLMRGIGSNNVDFRTRQSDFGADGHMAGAPWLGMKIADIPQLDRVLVVGSTLRKDHPLIAHRLRQAAKRQLQINVINPVDDDWLMRVANKAIVAPSQLAHALAQVVKAVAQVKSVAAPAGVQPVEVGGCRQAHRREPCVGQERGDFSRQSRAASSGGRTQLHAAGAGARRYARREIRFSRRGGQQRRRLSRRRAAARRAERGANARRCSREPRKAYVLLGVEPELDCHDPAQAMARDEAGGIRGCACRRISTRRSITHTRCCRSRRLPRPRARSSAPRAGCRVSAGVVQPLAETRPAWKVLRVLGNLLGLTGFDYDSSEAVLKDALGGGCDRRASRQSPGFRSRWRLAGGRRRHRAHRRSADLPGGRDRAPRRVAAANA